MPRAPFADLPHSTTTAATTTTITKAGPMTTAALEPPTIRSPELIRRAGLTPRIVDYWVRTGVICPHHRARGSGDQHLWTEDQVAIAGVLRRLGQLGAEVDTLRLACHVLELALEHDGRLPGRLPGWLVVTPNDVIDVDQAADLAAAIELAGSRAWVVATTPLPAAA